MKALVLIDIPEDDSLFVLSPFLTKVTLDYGNKILEVYGDVCAVPEKDKRFARNNAYHYQCGWNDCVDKILGKERG